MGKVNVHIWMRRTRISIHCVKNSLPRHDVMGQRLYWSHRACIPYSSLSPRSSSGSRSQTLLPIHSLDPKIKLVRSCLGRLVLRCCQTMRLNFNVYALVLSDGGSIKYSHRRPLFFFAWFVRLSTRPPDRVYKYLYLFRKVRIGTGSQLQNTQSYVCITYRTVSGKENDISFTSTEEKVQIYNQKVHVTEVYEWTGKKGTVRQLKIPNINQSSSLAVRYSSSLITCFRPALRLRAGKGRSSSSIGVRADSYDPVEPAAGGGAPGISLPAISRLNVRSNTFSISLASTYTHDPSWL